MKPLSTLMRPLRSVDVETGEPADALRERSDVCAVSPAAVVGEQMVAFVLAQQTLDQFGGTTVTDYQSAACSYRERLEQF
jgi:chorismate synthase